MAVASPSCSWSGCSLAPGPHPSRASCNRSSSVDGIIGTTGAGWPRSQNDCAIWPGWMNHASFFAGFWALSSAVSGSRAVELFGSEVSGCEGSTGEPGCGGVPLSSSLSGSCSEDEGSSSVLLGASMERDREGGLDCWCSSSDSFWVSVVSKLLGGILGWDRYAARYSVRTGAFSAHPMMFRDGVGSMLWAGVEARWL